MSVHEVTNKTNIENVINDKTKSVEIMLDVWHNFEYF